MDKAVHGPLRKCGRAPEFRCCSSRSFAVEWREGRGPEEFCISRVFGEGNGMNEMLERAKSLPPRRTDCQVKLLFVGRTLFVDSHMQLLA